MEVFDYAAYEAEQKLLREKAMLQYQQTEYYKQLDVLMYGGAPVCQSGFEYDIDDYGNTIFNCVPKYMVEQKRIYQQAQQGKGFVFRDNSTGTSLLKLVDVCPSNYAPRGVECVSYNDLNLTTAEYIAMENKRIGLIPVKDAVGNTFWYKTTEAADKAKAEMNIQNPIQAPVTTTATDEKSLYSERQASINTNVCSVDEYGSINNPSSKVTNGMNLSQYIGQFKVTDEELAIAKASCPNNIVSEATFGTKSYEKDMQAKLETEQAVVRKNERLEKYAVYGVLALTGVILLRNILKKD